VRRVAGMEQFVLSLKDAHATIRVEMDRALVDQTGGFDCEVYANFVHVYEGTGRVATIPQKLQEAFMELSAAIYESIMTRRAELKNIAKFKEIFKILTDGQYSVLSVDQQIVSWHRGSASHESSLKAIEDLAKQLWEAAARQVTWVLQHAPVEGMNFHSFHVTLKTATRFIHFGGTVIDLLGGQLEAARYQITTRYYQIFHGGLN
jgi:hypothetical protein